MTLAIDEDALADFGAKARKMYFSKDTLDEFLNHASQDEFDCVHDLLSREITHREEARKKRLMRKAKFPVMKSVEAFDFGDVAFPEGYTEKDITSLEFIQHAQDFVFFGKTGRGKSHLATALGIKCVEAGYEVRFYTTAALVRQLTNASSEGKLDALLKDIGKADLIILDEFGYIPLDIDGARLLFQVIAQCYEKRSMILTTNIEFSKWGTVFADEKLAAAAIDRVIHHGRLIEFTGSSRRMDESLMLGKVKEQR